MQAADHRPQPGQRVGNGTGHLAVLGVRQRDGAVHPLQRQSDQQCYYQAGTGGDHSGDGSVTGQVSNSTAAFNGDRFLFVNEDGTISGCAMPGTNAETLQLPSSDAVYKGKAQATVSGNAYLYAANFHSGAIDVLKGTAGALPILPGDSPIPDCLLAMRPSTFSCWEANST